jgi:hypothetical protein
MKKGATGSNKLPVWGDSLLNKLPATTRKRRKRQASKKRRAQLHRQDASE